MTGKIITTFLWGMAEASLIWLVCLFPPASGSWTPVLLFPLTASSLRLGAICIAWLVDNFNE